MNLNQVTLPAINVQQSIDFYRLLGFILIVDANPRYARFECTQGDSTFSVHSVETVETVGSGFVIYFECDELDEKVQQLQLVGVTFDTLPEDQPWLWREARLTDPSGNSICLFSAGKNRKNPPWRVAQ